MSSWSPDPGMRALSQVGLAPGPWAGRGVCCGGLASGFMSSRTMWDQWAAVPCSCVFECELCIRVYVRRQASGQDQDRQSSVLGLEESPSRAPWPESLFKGPSEMAKTKHRRKSHCH